MFKVSKFLPQINAFCFRSLNRTRTFIGLRPKSEYKLISRADKLDISQIEKKQYWHVPNDASSFDYVLIGKKSDPTFTREVLSCFNENGDVISRCYRDNGINTRLRLYKYEKDTRIVKAHRFNTSRIDKSWQNKHIMNIGGIWDLLFTEIQHIKHLKDLYKKGKNPTLLAFKRIEPVEDNSQRYTFIQFPMNMGFDRKSNKKIFKVTLTKTKDDIILSDMEQSENLYLNFKDKFLPYRILNPRTQEGIVEMTKGFLKELGLNDFQIKIIPNSTKVSQNSDAEFSHIKREISYRIGFTEEYILHIVDTIRHEIEHAWQHIMIGRVGKGKSSYETEALQKFGELKNPDDIEEAIKLAIAKEKYPRLKENEDLSKNIEYITNYMEVKANEAGGMAAKEYTKAKDNYIFFEQFS